MKALTLARTLLFASTLLPAAGLAQINFKLPPVNPCGLDIEDHVYFVPASTADLGYGKFRKTLHFFNNSAMEFSSTVSAVLYPMSSGWSPLNHKGITKCGSWQGPRPYFELNLGPDNKFSPGEMVSLEFEYEKNPNAMVSFAIYVRAGVPLTPLRVPGDFDGDGRADLTLLNPGSRTFTHRLSADLSLTLASLDAPENPLRPVIADYDGDGIPDYAYWAPNQKIWRIRYSSTGATGTHGYGYSGDVYPAPADYDGDGRVDRGLYVAAEKKFLVSLSGCGCSTVILFSAANPQPSARPAPADFDGDGKAEYALHEAIGSKFKVRSAAGQFTEIANIAPALVASVPVPADYDGDGRADHAVYAPSTGNWYVRRSTNGTVLTYHQGGSDAGIATPMDFDGDGRTDFVVYTPALENFQIVRASGKILTMLLTDTTGNQLPAIVPLQQLY